MEYKSWKPDLIESIRELHDLRSFVRVDTALNSSRAVRASVSRMVVGVVDGVDDACCCCCCCVEDSVGLSLSS